MQDEIPKVPQGRQVVNGYGGGGFKIGGQPYEGSVLVFADQVVAWSPGALDAVTAEGLAPVFAAGGDILVLGTGSVFGLCPPDLRRAAKAAGFTVESMATPAACRTFNVLVVEDRRVAAALIAV